MIKIKKTVTSVSEDVEKNEPWATTTGTVKQCKNPFEQKVWQFLKMLKDRQLHTKVYTQE